MARFLWTERNVTLKAQFLLSYEKANADRLLGRENRNSGSALLYLGPACSSSVNDRVSANLGLDLPLRRQNEGLQNMPDFRVHAGLSVRF